MKDMWVILFLDKGQLPFMAACQFKVFKITQRMHISCHGDFLELNYSFITSILENNDFRI